MSLARRQAEAEEIARRATTADTPNRAISERDALQMIATDAVILPLVDGTATLFFKDGDKARAVKKSLLTFRTNSLGDKSTEVKEHVLNESQSLYEIPLTLQAFTSLQKDPLIPPQRIQKFTSHKLKKIDDALRQFETAREEPSTTALSASGTKPAPMLPAISSDRAELIQTVGNNSILILQDQARASVFFENEVTCNAILKQLNKAGLIDPKYATQMSDSGRETLPTPNGPLYEIHITHAFGQELKSRAAFPPGRISGQGDTPVLFKDRISRVLTLIGRNGHIPINEALFATTSAGALPETAGKPGTDTTPQEPGDGKHSTTSDKPESGNTTNTTPTSVVVPIIPAGAGSDDASPDEEPSPTVIKKAKPMSTATSAAADAFPEYAAYLESFGYQAQSLREERKLNRSKLAEEMVEILDVKSEPVTQIDIRNWEKNYTLPTDTQFRALVSILIDTHPTYTDEQKAQKLTEFEQKYMERVNNRTAMPKPGGFADYLEELRKDLKQGRGKKERETTHEELAAALNDRLGGKGDDRHLAFLKSEMGDYIKGVEANTIQLPKNVVTALVAAFKTLGKELTEEEAKELYRRYEASPQPEAAHAETVNDPKKITPDVLEARKNLRKYFTDKDENWVGTTYIHKNAGLDASTLSRLLGESDLMPFHMGPDTLKDRGKSLGKLMKEELGKSDGDVTAFLADLKAFNELVGTHKTRGRR